MYDAFSQTYDQFVNWQSRLGYEMPFIEEQLARVERDRNGGRRILDAACGTGMHAIALAQRGYHASGADLSPAMVAQAQANAAKAGVDVDLRAVGFGELAASFVGGAQNPALLFDGLLCLGNSLPHVLQLDELRLALEDFAACLLPKGMLILQNRNFDAVMVRQERWMEPQYFSAGGEERLFLRFYDFRPDGLIDFNIVALHRAGDAPWEQHIHSTRLYPLRQETLTAALAAAGFEHIEMYGDMQGGPFNKEQSGNLIIACRRG
jgi:glycine/sarcosine N-methyltransferase